jgi:hypothetical protein
MSGTNGAWTLDISNAGFKEVISAVATAQANQSTITAIPVATIRTYSPASVTGWVLRSSSGGIIVGGMWMGSAFVTTPTRVFVQVTGY